MSSITAAVWLLFIPVAVLIGIVLWATEDRQQRARRWRRAGWSQQRIADRLGVSRSTVRRWASA
jgi:DNA invertase Pin-like site-specific DNA recombinase